MEYIIPFISAFVGYITNLIAVVMLFRPYRTVKLGKLTFFPQGLIPKNRQRIAASIGSTVANELLTTDDILSKIHTLELKKFLAEEITKKLQANLNRRSLFEIVPEEFGFLPEKLTHLLSKEIKQGFLNFIRSDEMYYFLEQNLRIQTELPAELKEKAQDFLAEQICQALKEYLTSSTLEKLLMREITKLKESQKTLAEFLPSSFHTALQENLPALTAYLLERIGNLIQEEETSVFVGETVSDYLLDVLKRDYPFIAGFIPAEMLKKIITEVVTKGAPKLKEMSEKETSRQKIESVIKKLIEDLGTTKVSALAEVVFKPYVLKDLSVLIGEKLLNEDLFMQMKAVIKENFSRATDKAKLFWDENAEEIAKVLQKKTEQSFLENSDLFDNFIGNTLDLILQGKLVLDAYYPLISAYLSARVENWIVTYLPSLLKEVDTQSMIAEKVGNFPLPELERIIRKVANRELKYITYFGAVVGFIIGIIQLLILEF